MALGNIVKFFFTGDSTSAVRAMQEVGVAAEGTAAKVTASDEEMTVANAQLDRSMMGLRGTMGMLAGPLGFLGLAYGVGESIKQFSSFQQQMLMLQTQTGASAAEVRRMSAAVLNLAPQVGIGPTGLAMGLYHLESAGVRGAKALSLLRVAAQGAALGNANLEDVTNALNAAVVSNIKGVQNYQQAMGVLNATVGAGDMRMQDLADAMGHGTLAIAKNFGLSIVDVGAALATFGDNNIRGANAATMLRMGLSRMLPVSTTAVKAFAAIGLSQKQLVDDMRGPKGLLGALEDLRQHMLAHGVTGSAATLQMQEMFGGSRTSAGIVTLYNQIDRLRNKYAEVQQGATGFARAWQVYSHSLTFYIAQLKALGEVILVYVGKALNWLVGPLRTVVHWLGGMKTIAVAIGVELAGWVAYAAIMKANAIATALWGAAMLALDTYTAYASVGMGGLTAAWAAFTAVVDASPVGLIAIAFQLLAALIVLIIFHFKTFKQVVGDVVNWIVGAFMTIVNFFGSLPGKIAKIAVHMWDGMVSALKSVVGWIIDFINSTLGTIHLPFGLGSIHLFTIGNPFATASAMASSPTGSGVNQQPYAPQRSIASATPQAAPSSTGGNTGTVVVHHKTVLNDRVLAESTTRYAIQKHAAS